MNRWKKYVIWVIVIAVVMYIGSRYQVQLEKQASMNFRMFPLMYYMVLFPIGIGLLLRLPKFIDQIKSKTAWTFDWVKLLIVGVPALYVAAVPVTMYTLPSLYPITLTITLFSSSAPTIAGVIFGYVLLDSLKK